MANPTRKSWAASSAGGKKERRLTARPTGTSGPAPRRFPDPSGTSRKRRGRLGG